MGCGCNIILELEESGEGLQWHNYMDESLLNSSISMGAIIFCMLSTSTFFILFTFYIEKVFPGGYGIGEKWHFPLQSSFWCGGKKTDDDDEENDKDDGDETGTNDQEKQQSNPNPDKYFEEESLDSEIGISIKDLTKNYSRDTAALKELTMNMYKNQVTVLVGHNGAGKSTIVKILTGMIAPTSGTVTIEELDIQEDLEDVKRLIGICPQENILFDELTVSENIEFFSRLKGFTGKDVEEEVKYYVKVMNLKSKADAQTNSLSVGYQRRLALGIAFCGDSTIILCDEPSCGLDVVARHELWDLLSAEKIDRTIIYTTHQIDEADHVGDRIAIMVNGELKALGSPFFLKKLGEGYRLVLLVQDDCQIYRITQLIRRFVQSVEISQKNGNELSYILPYDIIKKSKRPLSELFEKLEDQQEYLKIDSFSLVSSQLEDVFLKVGLEQSKENDTSSKVPEKADKEDESDDNGDNDEYKAEIESASDDDLLHGCSLHMNHYCAMFKKRFFTCIRNWPVIVMQNLIVVVFIVLSCLLVQDGRQFYDLPKLDITLETYDDTVTTLEKFPENYPLFEL